MRLEDEVMELEEVEEVEVAAVAVFTAKPMLRQRARRKALCVLNKAVFIEGVTRERSWSVEDEEEVIVEVVKTLEVVMVVRVVWMGMEV